MKSNVLSNKMKLIRIIIVKILIAQLKLKLKKI
jgi:hypothetical protein